MSVRVHCPGCQSLYTLPDRLSGKTVRCKGCSATFVVPGGAQAIAAKAAPKKPAVHDGAIQKTPQRAKTNPAAKGGKAAAPRRSGNTEKSPRSRKAMPLALVALFVGGIVVLGGTAGLYFWLTGDATQTTQAAKAKPIVQPQVPAAVIPKEDPNPKLTEDTDDNAKDKIPTQPRADSQRLDPVPGPQPQPKVEVPVPKKEVRPEKVEPKIDTPNPDPAVVTAAVSYTKHIQPFMKQYCTSCHGAQKPKAGISVNTFANMMRAGKGSPLIVPGEPDKSRLVMVIERKGKVRAMPPANRQQPNTDEKVLLRQWVLAGAKDDTVKAGTPLASDFEPRLPLGGQLPRGFVTGSVTMMLSPTTVQSFPAPPRLIAAFSMVDVQSIPPNQHSSVFDHLE